MTFHPDKPETWATKELHSLPLGFSIRAFQKKIDAILGLTEEGLPVCRLVWAPDITKTYSKFYCNWTAMGFGTETELRSKYRYATLRIPGMVPETFIDIPPPRWVIEEHNSYGQCAASWEAARWNKAGKEVRPPPPLEGYYSELFTIAEHDDCCEKAKNVVCWGKYRLPAQKDLDRLQMAKNLREKDAYVDPQRMLSPETLALIGKESAAKRDASEALKDKKISEYIDENALELIEKFTGQKNTKFSKEKGLLI